MKDKEIVGDIVEIICDLSGRLSYDFDVFGYVFREILGVYFSRKTSDGVLLNPFWRPRDEGFFYEIHKKIYSYFYYKGFRPSFRRQHSCD